MSKPTICIGFLLILVGVGGYLAGHPDPVSGHVSYTALIPAWVGLALAVCGIIALKPAARMHAMHTAILIGLLAIIAVAVRLPQTWTEYHQTPGTSPLKLASMLSTLLLCLIFVALCVRSFIHARRNRKI
jgi:heme O synthase-like polyprenyltransferase